MFRIMWFTTLGYAYSKTIDLIDLYFNGNEVKFNNWYDLIINNVRFAIHVSWKAINGYNLGLTLPPV